MWEKVASEKSEAFISVGAGREDAFDAFRARLERDE